MSLTLSKRDYSILGSSRIYEVELLLKQQSQLLLVIEMVTSPDGVSIPQSLTVI